MDGSPEAGNSTLFEASISVRASICASTDSGTCTAIWSPSKSALNAEQTSGCSCIALPSIRIGSNACMPQRCSVGPRVDLTRVALLLGGLDRGCDAHGLQAREDEGLEQFQRHQLGQTALVQLERRAYGNHRAPRVVDALAQQVLAETPALALDHVGQRLERALVGTGHGFAAAAVVQQRIDGFLQHALFVAGDD